MSLPLEELAYQQAHIGESRVQDVVIATVVCLAIAWLSVLLRMISRRIVRARLQADDWMILVGVVSDRMFLWVIPTDRTA